MTMLLRSDRRIIVASILLLVMAGGCRNSIHIISSSSWSGPSVKQTKTASAQVEGASKLNISSDFGSITTEASTGSVVEVKAEVTASGSFPEAELKSWLDKAQTTIRRDGKSLVVETKRPEGMPKEMGMFASYTVRAPASLALDLHSANGSITASGGGSGLTATSSFGAVEARDFRGDLKLHSDNGSIDVSNVTGNVDASSSFGQLKLHRIRGGLAARSDNGGIEAIDTAGDTTATSHFGEIELRLVKGAVDAKSDNGTLHASEVEADGKPVILKSSFGGVSFAGSAGTVTAHSDNGSVDLKLSATPRQTTATSSFGGVTVEIPKGADMDIDAGTSFGSIHIAGLPARAPAGDSKSWSGRVGAGGRTLKAHSDNGSVTIRGR